MQTKTVRCPGCQLWHTIVSDCFCPRCQAALSHRLLLDVREHQAVMTGAGEVNKANQSRDSDGAVREL